MNYPNMVKEYEQAAQRMANAIQMARSGKYREGYLSILIDGLEMMETAARHVGRHSRDGQMIRELIAEFRGAINEPQEEAGPSPLADLFQPDSDYTEAAQENQGPIQGRRMMGR